MDIRLSLQPRQTEAFESRATELLYGGAAGGGKSFLMRCALIVWCASIAGLRAYLLRREYPDLIANHLDGPSGLLAMVAPWIQSKHARWNGSEMKLTLWNGSSIKLGHCQHEKDIFGYQGAEIHVLAIDELTHFSATMYRFLRTRVRMAGLRVPPQFEGMFPRILASSNPGGLGHNWVRRAWVTAAPPGEVWRAPRSEGGMLRAYIPALLEDNPALLRDDPEYAARLEGLGDPALVRAMLRGDWDIVAGGALDDVWSPRVVVPRFKVPASWRVDRSFDWGSAAPFAVAWWAEADGTEATLADGSRWAPPRGSLVLVDEWYGGRDGEGLRLPAGEVARRILEREGEQRPWYGPVHPGPADNAIAASSQPGVPTIEDEMARAGVAWTRSDKSPGTRVQGLARLRSLLDEAGKPRPERPGLWVMAHCRAAIEQLPVLPRDRRNPEDVDTGADDHLYDAIRYRVLDARHRYHAPDAG